MEERVRGIKQGVCCTGWRGDIVTGCSVSVGDSKGGEDLEIWRDWGGNIEHIT